MQLKDLMVDVKSAWVSYPGLEGFEVEVVHLGREKLVKLRKSCMENIFDRKTRQPIERLDEKKFVSKFTEATIKNWKGFKLSYLEELIPVDLDGQDLNKTLDFSTENAELLVSNSADFDTWLNEVVFDLANFRGRSDRDDVEKAGDLSE